MSTDNKVLKIAGKDPSGLVKGIKVREDGEIVASDGAKILKINRGTLAAGGKTVLYTLTDGRPCRVFVFVTPYADIPWELKITQKQLDTLESAGTSVEHRNRLSAFDGAIKVTDAVISSGGQVLEAGYGSRASGWSNLTESEVTGFNYQLTNNSSTESFDYQLIVVSYPYETLVEDRLKSVEKHLANLAANTVEDNAEYPEVVSHNATLSSLDPSSVAYDSDSYTRIEHLDFASTSADEPTIKIQPKNKDGSLQGPISIGNAVTGLGSHIAMATIRQYKSNLFDIASSDGSATVVSLNRYMTFPHGLTITLEYNKEDEIQTSIRGYFVRRD